MLRLLAVFIVLMSVSISSCNRFSASHEDVFSAGTPEFANSGLGASSQVSSELPVFAGIQSFTAGSDWIHLGWSDATDNKTASAQISYAVYLATGPGDHDFSAPSIITSPGQTSITLPATNGQSTYAIVRAIDGEGNEESNQHEWSATPNPILYVSKDALPGGDGLSPNTAFTAIGQAIAVGIPLGAINIFVSKGIYSENVFLFEGMCLYGGFENDFSIDTRNPRKNLTELSTQFEVDLVTIASSSLLTSIDGFVLSGNQAASSGVLVRDARFRISNCEIRDALIHGIDIASDFAGGDESKGSIRGCIITGSGAEGVSFLGLINLVLDDCRIERNTNEGVESQWIYASKDSDTRIEITRCQIQNNGEEGIDLDFAEVSELDPSQSKDARVRVLIRGNEIRNNIQAGLQLDIDFENSDMIDYRCRVEDNQISENAGPGILIDGDAKSSFRVTRNVLSANLGPGIEVSGSYHGPFLRLSHCRILGNSGHGVKLTDRSVADLRNLLLAHNKLGAIHSDKAYVSLANSILKDNPVASAGVSASRYLLLDNDPSQLNGEGIFSGASALENTPLAVEFLPAISSNNELPLAVGQSHMPEAWRVGNWIEVNDDGIAREIIARTANSIEIEPMTSLILGSSPVLFSFGQGQQNVNEAEGLQVDSLALDSGDPLEFDRDKSRSDLGPNSGNTPGNIGLETALPVESTPLEVISFSSNPSRLLSAETLIITFNQDLRMDFADAIQYELNSQPIEISSTIKKNEFEIHLFEIPSSPGDSFSVDINSLLLSEMGSPKPIMEHQSFDFVLASGTFDSDSFGISNNSLGSAQQLPNFPIAIQGAIQLPGDIDLFQIDTLAGQQISVELSTSIDNSQNLSLRLLDASGAQLAESLPALLNQDPAAICYESLEDQTLYIEILGLDLLPVPESQYGCEITECTSSP